MKTVLGAFLVIGLYMFMLFASGRAASELCEDHAVGSPIDSIEDIEGSFFLKRMGPVPDPDQPGAQYAIFCASLMLCETSCRLTVRDGLVVEARFSTL